MSLLLRTRLGPLALTLLLVLQVAELSTSEANRGPRIVKTAKTRAAHAQKRGKPAKSKRPAATLRVLRSKSAKTPLRTPKALRTDRSATAPRAAKSKVNASRLGKPIKATRAALARLKDRPGVSRIGAKFTRMRTSVTRTLDRWQARAPPWLAKTMGGLRTYSLPSIAAYTFSKLGQDKVFLGSYFAGAKIVSWVILPGATAFGLDPILSGVLNAMTTPISLGVIVFREKHNRSKAGENLSLGETATTIGREYRDFAKARRVNASTAAKSQVAAR